MIQLVIIKDLHEYRRENGRNRTLKSIWGADHPNKALGAR